MNAIRAGQDTFQKMLAWSGGAHALLLTSMTLASYLGPSGGVLPEASTVFMNVVDLGESGPILSGTPTVPDPGIIRPPVRQRDDIPQPDAPVKKSPDGNMPKRDFGKQGPDVSTESVEPKRTNRETRGVDVVGSDGGSPFPSDQEFEYTYYVQQMLGRIQQHWQRKAVRGTAVVIVRFTILKDGAIRDARIEHSSGSSILDRDALRAVVLADPMPPLPHSYSRDRVGVHLRFSYSDSY